MGALLVNEIVASETPERSMSLKCVPVKHESNTQASEIEHSIGENSHQRNAKSMKSSLLFAQKQTFSTKVLRQRSCVSLAIISTTTSRATAVGARLFKLLVKNLVPETPAPIEVLENKAFQQNWLRLAVLERGFRTRFPTSRWSAALMTVVCTAQTPSN